MVQQLSGIAHRRIEGPEKVTGKARYTADLTARETGADLLHACVVQSTAAPGRMIRLETSAAGQIPGVRGIVTHHNAARLKKVKTLTAGELDFFLPLQDDLLRYYGQPIAIVVAETLAQARHGVSLITAESEDDPSASLSFIKGMPHAIEAKKVAGREPGKSSHGSPAASFAAAPVQMDLVYVTACAHHNTLEPAASIAAWDDEGRLTAWHTSQFVYGDAMALAEAFDFGVLEGKGRLGPQLAAGMQMRSKIRVIAPLVGGAFGSKASGSTALLAALAAKAVGAPVKLVLTREQTYAMMPYRSATHQRVRLGARKDGTLLAVLHDSIVQTSKYGGFVEPVGEVTPHLYACDHISTSHTMVPLDTNAPGWMRAPGVAPGLFGLECAMDELAERLSIDPLDLRLHNHADVDPATGRRWSSKSLQECYRRAAEWIGWRERDPRPGVMRDGEYQVGFGMSSAIYPTNQFPAFVRITLSEREALVESAVHEIGQGGITALTQIAAEALQLPLECVHLKFGDTRLPFGFITAGSSTALSTGTAIQEAAKKLLRDLALLASKDEASPLYGCPFRSISFSNGRMFRPGDPLSGETFSELISRHPRRTFRSKAITGRSFGRSRFARFAFGAHFVRVGIHMETRQVQVCQAVGAFACGRIINPVLVRSQLLGGMVWGIGQALFEESRMDPRNGKWVTSNLAEALVPTHADAPELDVLLVEEDDSRGSALGVKGVGEIGITGMAPAIVNAIFHATGRRIRELPATPERLMTGR